VHVGEEGHARPGWTISRQRTGMNGESTSMVWPTLGSRTAKVQIRTELCVSDARGAHTQTDSPGGSTGLAATLLCR